MVRSKISKSSFSRPLFSNTFWVPRTDIVSYFPKLCLSMLWKPISANASYGTHISLFRLKGSTSTSTSRFNICITIYEGPGHGGKKKSFDLDDLPVRFFAHIEVSKISCVVCICILLTLFWKELWTTRDHFGGSWGNQGQFGVNSVFEWLSENSQNHPWLLPWISTKLGTIAA